MIFFFLLKRGSKTGAVTKRNFDVGWLHESNYLTTVCTKFIVDTRRKITAER